MADIPTLQAFGMTLNDVRKVLDDMVHDKLGPIQEFSIDGSKEWSQQIGNDVKERLKQMGTDPNYKY